MAVHLSKRVEITKTFTGAPWCLVIALKYESVLSNNLLFFGDFRLRPRRLLLLLLLLPGGGTGPRGWARAV